MKNLKIIWSVRSECGPEREKNEDAVYPEIGGSDTPPFKAAVCDGLGGHAKGEVCLLYTSPSPRDISGSRMPSSA